MTCPNCDLRFEGDRCPNCGHSAWGCGPSCLGAALLLLLVVPSAFVGACSLHTGITFNPALSGAPIKEAAFIVGLFALFVCAIGLFWVWKLWRK